MFVQLFKGPVGDPVAVRLVLDEWVDRFAAVAATEGWLGSTGGVTSDGTLIAVGQFEAAEDARRNGDRPGQDEWWPSLVKLFTGPVVFRNCTAVEVGRGGGDPRARFVQVVEGRTSDIARMRALGARVDEVLVGTRPDLLGLVVALHDEEPGRFTQVAYFTDEQAARQQERALSGPAAELFAEMSTIVSDVTYLDLAAPWLDWPPETAAP